VAERFMVRVRVGHGTPPSGLAFEQPRIALYSGGGESADHMRFLLGKVWELPYDRVGGQAIKAGALSNYDVFVVPGVSTSYLNHGRKEIRSWIASGGVYVGTARPGGTGGTAFAVRNGWTTSALSSPAGFGTPGAMFRVALNDSSPVTLGAPAFTYSYDIGERVLSVTVTGANAGLYPTAAPDFFVSGYATGENALKGSAALVDETLGDGHLVLFSGEPNYRAFTGGTEFLLANALVYPPAAGAAGVDVRSAAAASAVSTAMASAGAETGPGAPIRIQVPVKQVKRARAVIRTFTQTVKVRRSGGSAFLTIPNPDGLDVEEHPFAIELLPALSAAGVEVRSAIL
jgi:hypothetical protein